MIVPTAIGVCIGEGFFEERDRRRAREGEVVDGGICFHADRVDQFVRNRPIGKGDLREATVGTDLRGTRDPHEGFGARVCTNFADRLELASVGEGVGDRERMEEIGNIVVEIRKRDGQLVELVAAVVVDAEVVAALDNSRAVCAILGAGNGKGETVFEGLLVDVVCERLGEENLHRIVVVDSVAVALRPSDIHALIGAARLNRADEFGHMGIFRGEEEVA